ncbi:MAG: aminoacyl-tRNA hydrolase [Bacilli bacterium]|nr:aminoacyl-tRNA hydrolase [Bacilli bacterium]MDD4298034.1 aminoacyl-tRNA hydrolase [Bacilli bacterium]
MKLIVGLGNPGKEYQHTRHNVGFMVIDALANKLGVKLDKRKKGGLYCQTIIDEEKVILLKPQRFVNLSGEVILEIIKYFKIDTNDVLIVSDDLDMLVGTLKLKAKGSSGGHKGLDNIELCLKTNEYKRLKIGISNNREVDTKDYVLGNFSKEEQEIINKIIERCADITIDFIRLDFIKLMNKYN